MYHIFVDLEMQETDRKMRKLGKGLRNEVIEFGAVVYDDKLQEVDSYKRYVKPELSKHIRAKYVALTGITDAMVAGASNFATALADFCAWCGQFGSEITLYEWSASDRSQLLLEALKKEVELDATASRVLEPWVDVQRYYGDKVETNTQVALETAVWTLGTCFMGKAHDALHDARNTARVYALLQQEEDVTLAKQMLHHGTKEESIGVKLGDLFDLRQLLAV